MAARNGMGLMDCRSHVLIREVREAMVSVTADVVSANFRHADSFFFYSMRQGGARP